jgi:hypothetical protein
MLASDYLLFKYVRIWETDQSHAALVLNKYLSVLLGRQPLTLSPTLTTISAQTPQLQ